MIAGAANEPADRVLLRLLVSSPWLRHPPQPLA